MDRNSIIGIIIIAGILIGYTFLTKPSREEIAQQKHIADSIRIVESQKEVPAATFDSLPKQSEVPALQPSGI
jgi:YidC/Oxa1 family membrane protein insertase